MIITDYQTFEKGNKKCNVNSNIDLKEVEFYLFEEKQPHLHEKFGQPSF